MRLTSPKRRRSDETQRRCADRLIPAYAALHNGVQPYILGGSPPRSRNFMARVTVEDCIEKVPNRFGLVLLAGHRARSIANGAALTFDRDNDKNPVVALRELADDTV